MMATCFIVLQICDSVRDASRLMFPRCAKTMSAAPAIEAVNNGGLSLSNQTNTGISMAATMEPNET
jgi:hypothetical protein